MENVDQAMTYKIGISKQCQRCDHRLRLGHSYVLTGKYRRRPIVDNLAPYTKIFKISKLRLSKIKNKNWNRFISIQKKSK